MRIRIFKINIIDHTRTPFYERFESLPVSTTKSVWLRNKSTVIEWWSFNPSSIMLLTCFYASVCNQLQNTYMYGHSTFSFEAFWRGKRWTLQPTLQASSRKYSTWEAFSRRHPSEQPSISHFSLTLLEKHRRLLHFRQLSLFGSRQYMDNPGPVYRSASYHLKLLVILDQGSK